MIENIKARLKWCRERRHWTESQNEMDKLDEEMRILEIIFFASNWSVEEKCDT